MILSKEDKTLDELFEDVIRWGLEHTGREPSISCFGKSVDTLRDYVKAMPTPKQEAVGYRAKISGYWELFDDKESADQIYHRMKDAHEIVGNCISRKEHWSPPEPVFAASTQAAAIPEWTDLQCAEFISVAFRHVDIVGEFTWNDIRLGCSFANKLSAAPKPESKS
jgi:hypothetical protein